MRLWIIFGTMILSMIVSRLNIKCQECCHATKKFYKQKCELEHERLQTHSLQSRPISEKAEHRFIVWYTSECKTENLRLRLFV
jgi:hypothetical protein